MISYLCNKAKKIKQRNIKIDITKFELEYDEFDVEDEYHGECDKYKIWDLI